MKPIELNYIKKNVYLYPNVQISNNIEYGKRPIGKYGMMWLGFMKEHHFDRYNKLKISGKLIEQAQKIDDEAYNVEYTNNKINLMPLSLRLRALNYKLYKKSILLFCNVHFQIPDSIIGYKIHFIA